MTALRRDDLRLRERALALSALLRAGLARAMWRESAPLASRKYWRTAGRFIVVPSPTTKTRRSIVRERSQMGANRPGAVTLRLNGGRSSLRLGRGGLGHDLLSQLQKVKEAEKALGTGAQTRLKRSQIAAFLARRTATQNRRKWLRHRA